MEDEQQAPPVGKRIGRWIKQRPGTAVVAGLLLVVFAIIVYWAIWADSSPPWTGFGAYNEEAAGPRAKTLWDWLGLLIVPAALAGGVYWLNRSQKETELKIAEKRRKEDQDIAEKARTAERQIADNRQQQATLEAYYDRMTELLLEQDMRNSIGDSDARSIARARTIAVVKSLDGERNGQLFAFLKASKLMEKDLPIIDPAGMDLSGVKLAGANLRGANLGGASLSLADLRGADMREASLVEADMRGAEIRWANLSQANLIKASLSGADLSTANMAGTDLSAADLSTANLRKTDLGGARLNEADLSDADLSDADLSEANLSAATLRNTSLSGIYLSGAYLNEADLSGADLSGANLWETNLSEANLLNVNLSLAILLETDLRGAKNWTIEQFDKAETLVGATMPDGVRLKGDYNNGPTYAEWKALYLTRQNAPRA